MNSENRDELLSYAKSDLLCYFADAPEGLVEKQEDAWLPLLSWIKSNYAINFRTGTGIRYIDQDSDNINIIANLIDGLSVDNFNALYRLTCLTGSFIVAWAVIKRHINIEQAYNIAFIDDTYQINRWGEDDEARKRLDNIKAEMMKVELPSEP